MKLLSLHLAAFGHFTDTRLEFGKDGAGFHVIHGANEAGKSTAMRALTNLLFGFPSRTPDDFLHEARKLRIGGEVMAADRRRLPFQRRKGNARTLLDPGGESIDDSALSPFLGAATRETFETIFRLDHPGLIAGGKDLLEGKGNLAQSLFQAAAGITGLRRTLEELEAEAGELFKPNAARPRVNRALADYEKARRASREAALKPGEWSAIVATRDQLAIEVRALGDKLRSEDRRRQLLERQFNAHPHAHKRAALLREQVTLGEVTLLPPDAALRREETEKEQRRLLPVKEEALKHIEQLENQLAAIKGTPMILSETARIGDLAQRLREYRAALVELPDPACPARDSERGIMRLARMDEDIALRISQLGLWTGGIAELERLAVPGSETVARFEKELAELNAEKVRLVREGAGENEKIEKARAQARALQIGSAVPTEAELLEVRSHRDHGWRILLEAWHQRESATGGVDVRKIQTLESDHERAVRDADLLSDRLRREADRVAAHATFQAEAERGVAHLCCLDREIAEIEVKSTEKRREWTSVWDAAGIAPSTPAEMQPWLRRHEDLLRLATLRRSTAQTIADETGRFRGFVEVFSRETASLVRGVTPEFTELPPDIAVEKLQARLAQAQQDAARRQQIEQSMERERKALSKTNRELERIRLEFDTILSQTPSGTREALLEAEVRSEKARRLASEIESENRALAGHAGAQSLDRFAEETAALDRERVEVEIAQLSQFLRDAEPELADKQRRFAGAEAQVKSMDGSHTAAAASEEAQSFLAEAHDAAERYVRLHLAGAILRRQIERYRRENQDPVLHRASDLFSALTRRSFSGIVSDFREKDEPVLLGIRTSGEEVEVSGMSEGTRDQLYLALRVATLERQLQSGEPLPFVVDDVLVSFDDARARAALGVLSELSAKTQVLFFTHHTHLVELARQAVSASLLCEHCLRD